jgi:hypothetical protein
VPSSATTRNLSNADWKVVNPNPTYPNGYYGCSCDSLHLFFDQNDNLHLLWDYDAPLADLLTSTAALKRAVRLRLHFQLVSWATRESAHQASPWIIAQGFTLPTIPADLPATSNNP